MILRDKASQRLWAQQACAAGAESLFQWAMDKSLLLLLRLTSPWTL
jgi:hypothetical protein